MENQYIRKSFNGLTEEVYEWEQLNWAPFVKEEYRKAEAERELASSYMHAAEMLYVIMFNENNPGIHLKVIRTNQLCIPMLFLCRHAIELTLKMVIESITKEIEEGHELDKLWNKYKTVTRIKKRKYDELIKTFVEIDKDGMQLRYAKDLDGKEYKPTPTFVKADLIIKDTKGLYEFLLGLIKQPNIPYITIKKSGEKVAKVSKMENKG